MRPPLLLLSLAVAMCACSGGDDGGDDGAPVTLAFVSPAPGAAFTRDTVAANGALVAAVTAELAITGAPALVQLSLDGVNVSVARPDGTADIPVPRAGAATIVATAFDALGAMLATAEVQITVGEPAIATCHDWLDLYGVEYTLGPDNPGVDDPVTATVPINGMPYRYVENTSPRATMFADCTLILSLAKAAPFLHDRGVVEVADYGIYNYRCIGGGTPPDCPNGISQHAYATAIDLAQFTNLAGDLITVEDDFVIDPEDMPTCAAETEPGADAFLHELICALKDAGTWNIVLTPNYNADHRDHFHVDLTPDADFIGRRGPVDFGADNH